MDNRIKDYIIEANIDKYGKSNALIERFNNGSEYWIAFDYNLKDDGSLETKNEINCGRDINKAKIEFEKVKSGLEISKNDMNMDTKDLLKDTIKKMAQLTVKELNADETNDTPYITLNTDDQLYAVYREDNLKDIVATFEINDDTLFMLSPFKEKLDDRAKFLPGWIYSHDDGLFSHLEQGYKILDIDPRINESIIDELDALYPNFDSPKGVNKYLKYCIKNGIDKEDFMESYPDIQELMDKQREKIQVTLGNTDPLQNKLALEVLLKHGRDNLLNDDFYNAMLNEIDKNPNNLMTTEYRKEFVKMARSLAKMDSDKFCKYINNQFPSQQNEKVNSMKNKNRNNEAR